MNNFLQAKLFKRANRINLEFLEDFLGELFKKLKFDYLEEENYEIM